MFNFNFPDSTTIFILFIIVAVLIKSFSRKAQKRNNPAPLPGWYKTFRPVAQILVFLMIMSYFFIHKSYLLWGGIIGLVLLDVLHIIVSAITSMLYKNLQSDAAVNEQPEISQRTRPNATTSLDPMDQIREMNERLSYPTTFTQPERQTKNVLQPTSNIDHFSNRTGIFIALLIFMAVIFAAAVVYLFFLS